MKLQGKDVARRARHRRPTAAKDDGTRGLEVKSIARRRMDSVPTKPRRDADDTSMARAMTFFRKKPFEEEIEERRLMVSEVRRVDDRPARGCTPNHLQSTTSRRRPAGGTIWSTAVAKDANKANAAVLKLKTTWDAAERSRVQSRDGGEHGLSGDEAIGFARFFSPNDEAAGDLS